MDNPGYIALTRVKGLADEMRAVANNIANMATTGFRGESVVFAEVVVAAETDGGSLSMAVPRAHITDPSPGSFRPTGGSLDFAIEGDGFFQVQTPAGNRLTRAGSFMQDADGGLVTRQGFPVLDAGGAPIMLPPDARSIHVAIDGTIAVNGEAVGQIGLFTAPPTSLLREDGVMFRSDGPIAEAPEGRIAQGFLEESNVNPVTEISRMIEVQRAYELGQSFLEAEDARIREAVRTLGRSA